MSWLITIALGISLITSLLTVPLVRKACRIVGIVDKPDADRKLQSDAVALGGGVAVFVSLVASLTATLLIDRAYFSGVLGTIQIRWYVLFGSAAMILAVGLVDDLWELRGRQKLLLQILIISCLVGSGTIIRRLSLFSVPVELGVLAFPVTVLWLVVAVNALNLIDGADGMAGTVGMFVCLGMGALAIIRGDLVAGVSCLALAGALSGFLVFNKPPATIYLGDAGSMMIGLFVGVFAIWSEVKESAVLASAPIAILALPLFDSSAAILRRWLTGRSIYQTDRAHMHHMLQARFGNSRMLICVGILSLITVGLSVASVRFQLPWLSALGVAVVFGALVATRTFGYAETRLVWSRLSGFLQSFAAHPATCDQKKLHRRLKMQGDGAWETVWEPMVQFADSHHFAQLKIDLNLSWIQEGFHANWRSYRLPEKSTQVSFSLPLLHERENGELFPIGRLSLITSGSDIEFYENVALLGDFLADMRLEIDRIIHQLEAAKGNGLGQTSRTLEPQNGRETSVDGRAPVAS